jgi:2-dehydropantoate 2-reductase
MLVCTKLWDLAQTARELAPVVGPATVVVPFQNGVDAVDILGQAMPKERVAAGVAYISAVIGEPGTIAHTGAMSRLRVGALHAAQQDTLRAFVAAGEAAGFGCEYVQDPQAMIWEKFVALNALSGLTALTRQTVGAIRSDAHTRAVFMASVREGVALARASGVALPEDFVPRHEKMLDGLPEAMRASMAHDLLAGRRLEAPWLCGAVVRRAAPLGIDVPVNATIWAAMKPFVDGTPA